MEKPRAVIYVRVSDPSQIDNNSLETQEVACNQFIKRKGYILAREPFREEGISAKHVSTRPCLRELLSYCTDKKNRISFVIVYKLDRWSRNTQEGLAAEALLSAHGTELVSVTENISKDPTGNLLKTIFLATAQWDNEMKGERVRDNQKTMFRNGYWCWKTPIGYRRPYGTKSDRKGKECLIDEQLGPLIKNLFNEAAKAPKTKITLANDLNNLGFKKIFGNEANGSLVSKIISKTFYYGLMYASKWDEYSQGKHEPLIDKNTWERANINLFGKKFKYRFKDESNFPLKGLVLCSSCKTPLTVTGPVGNGRITYYECKHKGCQKHQRINIPNAHMEFENILKSIKPNERVLVLFEHLVFNEWEKSISECKERITLIDKRIKTLKDDLTGIGESNRKGIFTDQEAVERSEEVRREIVTVEIEKSDILIEQYDTEIIRNFTKEFLLNIDVLWNRLDLPMKQAFQGRIFPHGLICENKKIRTIGLSPSFELIHILKSENSSLVTLRGIEPRLAE